MIVGTYVLVAIAGVGLIIVSGTGRALRVGRPGNSVCRSSNGTNLKTWPLSFFFFSQKKRSLVNRDTSSTTHRWHGWTWVAKSTRGNCLFFHSIPYSITGRERGTRVDLGWWNCSCTRSPLTVRLANRANNARKTRTVFLNEIAFVWNSWRPEYSTTSISAIVGSTVHILPAA